MNYQLLPNEELVRLMQQDNQAAFNEIFSRFFDMVFKHAYVQLNGDAYLAEEITQTIFISIWEKRKQSNIANIKSYLLSSVKYNLLNKIKSDKIRSRYKVHIANTATTAENNIDNYMGLKTITEKIHKAVLALPEKTRIVFNLNRLEQKSIKEISAVLNLSEKAVEYHITKSLKYVKANIIA